MKENILTSKETRQLFSIRKFKAYGTASVLLGATIVGAPQVFAEEGILSNSSVENGENTTVLTEEAANPTTTYIEVATPVEDAPVEVDTGLPQPTSEITVAPLEEVVAEPESVPVEEVVVEPEVISDEASGTEPIPAEESIVEPETMPADETVAVTEAIPAAEVVSELESAPAEEVVSDLESVPAEVVDSEHETHPVEAVNSEAEPVPVEEDEKSSEASVTVKTTEESNDIDLSAKPDVEVSYTVTYQDKNSGQIVHQVEKSAIIKQGEDFVDVTEQGIELVNDEALSNYYDDSGESLVRTARILRGETTTIVYEVVSFINDEPLKTQERIVQIDYDVVYKEQGFEVFRETRTETVKTYSTLATKEIVVSPDFTLPEIADYELVATASPTQIVSLKEGQQTEVVFDVMGAVKEREVRKIGDVLNGKRRIVDEAVRTSTGGTKHTLSLLDNGYVLYDGGNVFGTTKMNFGFGDVAGTRITGDKRVYMFNAPAGFNIRYSYFKVSNLVSGGGSLDEGPNYARNVITFIGLTYTPNITIDSKDGSWIIDGKDTNQTSKGATGAAGTSMRSGTTV
ncbi:TPA: YSIRK-type signal peptide-containing protein, partial [Streptococcus suis]|nr:YSIRK-type signal peptide-containing protein [Streptococcus suis]